MTLIEHLKRQCLHHGIDHRTHVVVAYSGGVDSTALLHACGQIMSSFASLQAMHVHHGMHDDADRWAHHCLSFSQQLGIPCTTAHVHHVGSNSSNLECQLRDARHHFLAQTITTSQHVLLMAHHLEDNLVTQLKRMFTGSGPIGLVGIRACRAFGKGRLIRPLLSLPKKILQDHVEHHQCPWVLDPSNLDMRFERNVIEKKLLPIIQTQWPGMASAMDTMAQKQQCHVDIAKDMAIMDVLAHMRGGTSLHLNTSQLSAARQLNMLSHWLQQHHAIDVPHTTMMPFVEQCRKKRRGRHPALKITPMWTLRHHDDHMHLCPATPQKFSIRTWVDLSIPCSLSKDTTLITTAGCMRPPTDSETVTVRFREHGQRIKLHNKNHHQSIKKLMQDWRIPPWERHRVPMIFYNETCSCIVGHAICAGFHHDGEDGIAFDVKTLAQPEAAIHSAA